jgi:peptidoglycan/xylan/chitin deacetylase (PgdA/CDA1 family)
VSGRFEPLVLCYHAVSADWRHELSVTPGAVEGQVRWALRRGYRPATAAQVAAGSGKLLHVTFDDAFRSVLAGVEVLERLGVRGSVYACTAFAADGRPFDGGKLAPEAAAHPDELATLTFDALAELADRGVEIGSHTISHPRLTELADDELRRELVDSRAELEDRLGRSCVFLAYPFGGEDERVRRATRAAGYAGAFSLPGRQSPREPFGLPRVGLYRKDTTARAALKMSRPGRAFASLRHR